MKTSIIEQGTWSYDRQRQPVKTEEPPRTATLGRKSSRTFLPALRVELSMLPSPKKKKKSTSTFSSSSLAQHLLWDLLHSNLVTESLTPRIFLTRGIFLIMSIFKRYGGDRVEEIDELKDSQRIYANFARSSINRALEQIVTVGEYHKQLML